MRAACAATGTGVRVEFVAKANVAPGCHVLILRDITERVVAAEMLDLQHRQLVEAQVVGGFATGSGISAPSGSSGSDELAQALRARAGHRDHVRRVLTSSCIPTIVRRVRQWLRTRACTATASSIAFRVVNLHGVVRLLESRGAIVRADDGTPLRMFGTAQDVTDRVDVETARRNFSTILDGSDEAITALSPDGTFESWNLGAERLYGYTAEEAIGQSVEILFPDVDHESRGGAWRRVLRGRTG